MENKRINAKTVKNFLSNNAIIILIVILALVVGIITDNFFTSNNFKTIVNIADTPSTRSHPWPPGIPT